jgi:hypothetical protein
MEFCERHLEMFKSTTPGRWPAAKIPDRWFNSIGYAAKSQLPESFAKRPPDREDLHRILQDEGVDALDVCMLVFAWGGMTVKNGRGVLQQLGWVDTARQLRLGNIDHIQAYRKFFDHCAMGQMKYCGPAYYTKLLFFLPGSDEHRGIIMDQWTARSINLLVGKSIVTLVKNSSPVGSYRVSPLNDCGVYERFCEIVTSLAVRLGITTQETEKRLFSEGRGKGPWRNYVRNHDRA